MDPTDQRDIPYREMSSSAVKAGRKEEWETFRVMLFVFPSNHYA